VVSAAVLVFFAQTSTFHLMFDGLTYAALAKNILRSGDWSRLHYGLEQYPGLFAALVLISSTRSVKWASNFYLDGILSFFGLGAAILMSLASASEVRSTRRSRALMIMGGASLSCALWLRAWRLCFSQRSLQT
jgi:hypothetical protein